MQRRRLVQPLAVVAAFLTFALLFFGMAMMDLRQVEKLLHVMLKQKAISVAENIEGASRNTYHRIWRHGGNPQGFSGMLPECDSMPSIQDSLPKATEDEGSARYRAMTSSIRNAVAMWPVGGDVVYLAVEDNRGRLLAQTGNIPEQKVSECLLLAGNARDAGKPVSECVKIGNIKFLEVILPFTLGGEVVGKIRVGLETYQSDAMLQENRHHIFLWTALMMLIGIAAMGVIYRMQNRYLSRLQAVQEHLHHAEKLSSLAGLGARVAHEVRNPLNAIGMAAQRLQREFIPVESEARSLEFRHITRIIRDEIRRINAIIENFLGLSRSDRLRLCSSSLTPVIERVLFLGREAERDKNIRFELRTTEDARWMVMMDAPKMEQAIFNIVRNAAESIPETGTIVLCLARIPGRRIRIRVQDTGAGISAEAAARIFDPHYTTKPCGAGLGLAIAYEIVRAHGGEIQVQSKLNEGTIMDVLLPESQTDKDVDIPCIPGLRSGNNDESA